MIEDGVVWKREVMPMQREKGREIRIDGHIFEMIF
jgi:hypothetical protein